MATYRCPECGASHKEMVAACRLCGAPMEDPVTYRTVTSDDSIAAERFRPRSLVHFAWIGLAVAMVITVGALALGLVENRTLESWAQRLPFVDGPVDDAWFAWADPDELFIVDLPARPVPATGDVGSLDLGAPTTAWVTSVGTSQIAFGHTDGLDFAVPEGASGANDTIGAELREAIDDIADQQGVRVIDRSNRFDLDGNVAMDAVLDGFRSGGQPAYGSLRVVMVDGEIVFLQTVDFERNTDPHRRFRSSLVVVADNPDITIPTIPADAPDPGGTSGTDDA